MEKNLVVSTYPDQQESVVCQDPEPYLEAKLYMERMNMEHERDMGDHICGPLFPEEQELSNHWVALAAYPVPSVSLSHATVQWDVPDISSEIPSPETDICSVDELDSSGGAGLDWTINPLATDLHTPLFVEMEGPIATVEGCLQTDSELEYHPVNHADNCTDACQEHTTEDSDMKDGVTPSQIEDHRSVDGSREIMQAVEAAAELHPSGSEDNVPSPEEPQRTVCREDAGLLEEEKELECANPHTLNECGDTGKEDKGLELEQENEEWSVAHNRVELQWTPVEVSVMSFAVDDTVRGQPIKLEEPEQKQNTEEESNSLDQAEHTNLTDHERERTEESNQKSLLEEEHQSSTGKATDLPPQLSVSSKKLGQPGESELTELLEQMPVIEIPQQLEQPHPLNITTLPKRVELQIIGSKRSDELQSLEELGQSENTEQMEHPEVTNPQEGSACFEETQCKEEMEPNEQTKHSECSHQTELSEQTKQSECLLQTEPSEQSEYSQQMKLTEPSEQSECPQQTDLSEEIKQSECSQQTEPSEQTKQSECSQQTELSEQTKQSECSQQTELSEQTKQSECSQQTELSEQKKQSECSQQMEPSLQTNQSQSLHQTELSEQSEASECSEIMEPSETTDQSQLHRVRTELPEDNKEVECIIEAKESESPELLQPPEQTKQSECSNEKQSSQLTETGEQSNCGDQTWQSSAQHDVANEQSQGQTFRPASTDRVASYMNGSALSVDVQEARRLAERLYKLEGFQRTDVVRHFDKDNEFSRVVGEEYLKFFDFTGQSLDQALRSFFKEVVLIGETQERERVVQRFSVRFHECNPQAFSSAGAALTLTCAIMLLNTDLHGQNVGKAMSLPDFVSNLDGMNEGENFHKDLLKCFYNSIKNEPLEWAVDEKVLASSMMLEGDSNPDLAPRSKSNPFQDLPHDQKATVFQKGFLKRKAHADIDGKRIPWGKRSWKTFYAVLKGMVLYLQKDEYRMDWQCSEEVVSIHHALAERALDYTKRPHVFRLQTADWRVFLFEAASTEQMNSWIGRMNLVSALYSSPPFPAAVGSQRKFCRPILPASQSAHTLERQLQSHAAMLQSSQEDLATLQQALPEGRKAKARELEEHKLREEYLQHEKCRYEVYTQMLKSWQTLEKSSEMTFVADDLSLFDQEVWKGVGEEEVDEMDGGIKRSYSSPSLEVEVAPPPMVKVRRNISERRTYRKIIIPRRNKEL